MGCKRVGCERVDYVRGGGDLMKRHVGYKRMSNENVNSTRMYFKSFHNQKGHSIT